MIVTERTDPGPRRRRRGQAYTFEALTAVLVLLATIIVVLQMTAITPTSSSATNERVRAQLVGTGEGVLLGARDNETLKPTLLFWDDDEGSFRGPTGEEGYYVGAGPPTAFGRTLNRTLDAQGIRYNLNVQYLTADRQRRTQQVVRYGAANDDAVRVTTKVTLYDDDVLYTASGDPGNVTLGESSRFYVPDAAPNGSTYNVLEVELVLW